MVTLNLIEVAGVEPRWAVRTVNTQEVARPGATRRDAEIRHGEEVAQVTRPVDAGVTIEVNLVRVPRATEVLRTVKPAHTFTEVDAVDSPPVVVLVRKRNVSALPLGSPRMVQEVAVVRHQWAPSLVDNTYVGLAESVIADHRNVARPSPTEVRIDAGTEGAPLGVAETLSEMLVRPLVALTVTV